MSAVVAFDALRVNHCIFSWYRRVCQYVPKNPTGSHVELVYSSGFFSLGLTEICCQKKLSCNSSKTVDGILWVNWAATSESIPSDMCTHHLCSLIRIFSGHILDSQGCKVFYADKMLCTDCGDVQVDLSLLQKLMSESTFSQFAAEISSVYDCNSWSKEKT